MGREYLIYLRPRPRTGGGKQARAFDVEVGRVMRVGERDELMEFPGDTFRGEEKNIIWPK